MANTKVTQHVIANNAIQEAMITDAAVTPDKLHGTLDLSSKSLTLPSAAVATTQSASDNSTKLATTAYVTTAVSNLVDSAPSSLDTLNELAAALNDDASFSSTVTTSIAAKLPLAGGTMTGDLILGDNIKIEVGSASGGDLQIYHNGSHSFIDEQGTGGLIVRTGDFYVRNPSDADMIYATSGGAVKLYHNNSEKFETTAYGVSASGTGALKVPVGTTGQRPTAATGQIRWNSTDGALEVYNGSSWTAVGTSGSNKVLDTFTGDGSTTAFTLSVTPANEDALMVFIDGVYQEKGDYSLSNAVITLDTAPASGEKIAVHTTTASVHDGTSALTQQFTGDGSTTAFTLSQDPGGENNTQVFVNGVYQAKTTYSVSGTTLTFASAPANSAVIEVVMFTVATLGNSDTVTEGVSNLYHTSARAISAVSAGNLTGLIVDTNVLKVDASSNRVGIGTASPGSLLTVEGDIRQTTGDLLYQGGGNWDIKHLADDQNILFYTSQSGSTTEKLRIKANGQVKIGNTSGSGILNVDNGATDGGYVHFANNVGSTTLTNDKGLAFGWNKSNGGGESIIIGNQGAGSTGGLRFATNTSGGSYAERMTITSGGLVGIGTTGPSGNLHVASTGDGLVLSRSGYDTYSLQHSAGVGMAVYNVTDSRSEMLFRGDGKILIGSTSDSFDNNSKILLHPGSDSYVISSGQLLSLNRTGSHGAMIGFYYQGSFVGSISSNSNSLPSDKNFKRDISDLDLGLNLITKLKPSQYNYKIDSEDCPKMYGLIAQDLEESLTEVGVEKNSSWLLQHKPEVEEGSQYEVDYLKLTPVLIKAIQELEARVKELEG